jgi:hypothetical protein
MISDVVDRAILLLFRSLGRCASWWFPTPALCLRKYVKWHFGCLLPANREPKRLLAGDFKVHFRTECVAMAYGPPSRLPLSPCVIETRWECSLTCIACAMEYYSTEYTENSVAHGHWSNRFILRFPQQRRLGQITRDLAKSWQDSADTDSKK